jgi:hypothetical protein
MSRIRITMTRPTIDSDQAAPLLAGRPSVLNKVWNATMMKVTAE